MIDNNTLIPECYGDTVFFRMLTSRLGYKYNWQHLYSCFAVAKKMEDKRFTTAHLLGIVDNDKVMPRSIISNFTKVIENDFFIIKQKRDIHHYCILIKNAIEQWLLDAARFEHKYTLQRLKSEMKRMNAEENPNLKKFLNDIIQKNPPAIKELSKWISDFLKEADK